MWICLSIIKIERDYVPNNPDSDIQLKAIHTRAASFFGGLLFVLTVHIIFTVSTNMYVRCAHQIWLNAHSIKLKIVMKASRWDLCHEI